MLHIPVIPSPEVEAPFAAYLDNAREQVARNPSNLADQEGVAHALAVMNRDADRRDRYYLANKAAVDAARAAADRSINRHPEYRI